MTHGTGTSHSRIARSTAFFGIFALAVAGCSTDDGDSPDNDPTLSAESYSVREVSDGATTFYKVTNPANGATLSYSADSDVELIEETVEDVTIAFKDTDLDGELDSFEDWRLSPEERAASLAEALTVDQISGLMQFTNPQGSPADGVNDQQQVFIEEGHVRSILIGGGGTVEEMVAWSNAAQAMAEAAAATDAPGVPLYLSTNPMSSVTGVGATNELSDWPNLLGIAATGSVETMEQFAQMTSAEYRAVGVASALAPQIDLASDPRWLRNHDTLGESPELASAMAVAYVAGYQGTFTDEGEGSWGEDSVATTIKHFPGDGTGEGGRESHMDQGKYAIYPGDNFDEHVSVFEAAIDSASVMTSYSVAIGADGEPLLGDEPIGSAYDFDKMAVLRDDLGYTGSVVTDWGILESINDEGAFFGTGWGVDDLTREERVCRVLQTGHDQLGGLTEPELIKSAYDLWQADFESGEQDIDAETRWRESAQRILQPYFRTGIYDDAFLDLDESVKVAASDEAKAAGHQAQLNSVVMVKNDGVIGGGTDWSDKKVYIPSTELETFSSFYAPGEYTQGPSLDLDVAGQYFGEVITDEVELDDEGKVVSYTAPDLSDVDLVLVGMDSPSSGAYIAMDGYDAETGEYLPLSLQYRPYTADGDNVRKTSIAGNTLEDGAKENRSYFGNTSKIENEADLDAFERALDAVEAAGNDIPVIVALNAKNPVVPTEFESDADAIVVGFGVGDSSLIEIAVGNHEPAGKLPMGFPASMDAVEAQLEDVPLDMDTYVDEAGNDYAFGFGLNWSGPIG